MAATGVRVSSGFSPFRRHQETPSSSRKCRTKIPYSAVSSEHTSTPTLRASNLGENGRLNTKEEAEAKAIKDSVIDYANPAPEPRKKLNDFFEECREIIRSDGGPPRWFSPLDCGARAPDSPLLLFLPGIDGTGLSLITQHYKLGKIFDIWCLHIPLEDRTSYIGLVKMVEKTVRSENSTSPKRPIYLVGNSFGACIALDVAARNPDIDLVLILANPATSFSRSLLQPLIPLLEVLPGYLLPNLK